VFDAVACITYKQDGFSNIFNFEIQLHTFQHNERNKKWKNFYLKMIFMFCLYAQNFSLFVKQKKLKRSNERSASSVLLRGFHCRIKRISGNYIMRRSGRNIDYSSVIIHQRQQFLSKKINAFVVNIYKQIKLFFC
jgi:hypothetical protein